MNRSYKGEKVRNEQGKHMHKVTNVSEILNMMDKDDLKMSLVVASDAIARGVSFRYAYENMEVYIKCYEDIPENMFTDILFRSIGDDTTYMLVRFIEKTSTKLLEVLRDESVMNGYLVKQKILQQRQQNCGRWS